MYKRTIKYTDYNGVEREEDFYFNLEKAEIIEMQYGVDGGLQESINKIIKAKDQKEIIKVFKELLLKSYGEKSPDGKRFIKSEELSANFSQTPVYSELFLELATNDDEAARFINGITPSDVEITKEMIDDPTKIKKNIIPITENIPRN